MLDISLYNTIDLLRMAFREDFIFLTQKTAAVINEKPEHQFYVRCKGKYDQKNT